MPGIPELPPELINKIQIAKHFLEELRLVGTNVRLENIGTVGEGDKGKIIVLTATSDGSGGWTESKIAELAFGEHCHVALSPLSHLFMGQTRPVGEDILLVRHTAGDCVVYRVDNLEYSTPLQEKTVVPGAFSWTSNTTTLNVYQLQPRSSATAGSGYFSGGKPSEDEWWFWDQIIAWPKI